MRHFRAEGMRVILVTAAILLLSGIWASAQRVSGTLFGTVLDSSGAVVQGVRITATSVDTAAVRTTTTGSSGTYEIPGVVAGVYKIEASVSGFKTDVRTGVAVTVGTNVAVNFVLTVGSTTQTVEVVQDQVQVET